MNKPPPITPAALAALTELHDSGRFTSDVSDVTQELVAAGLMTWETYGPKITARGEEMVEGGEPAVTTVTIKVYGNAVTSFIRLAAERGDVAAVLRLAGGLSRSDLLGVVQGTSELTGNDVDGYTVAPTGRPEQDPYAQLKQAQESRARAQVDLALNEATEAIADWAKKLQDESPHAISLHDVAVDIRDWAWWEGSTLDPDAGKENTP